jgi:hypothetical protein
MVTKNQLEGFKAQVASHKSSSGHMEDVDGNHCYWDELSAEGKVKWIASDAAYYDVPFEPFAQAVREVLGQLPAAAREEAALWLALQSEREQRELEQLLPRYDRLEPAPPLVDRFRELLDYYEKRLAKEPGQDHDPEISR